MTENPNHDPAVDLDPQEALDADYNPDTDVHDSEAEPNDQAGENYTHEPVEGALPVDDSCCDLDLGDAEDEISEDDEEVNK